ncbi:hypothetical protein CL634_08210 [bacterium]|nr:hypothetical protein [bacterium]
MKVIVDGQVRPYEVGGKVSSIGNGIRSKNVGNKNIRAVPKDDNLTNVDKVVDKIIDNSGLVLADNVQEKRFRTVILSRFKDVRDNMETREILTRSKKVGGLELTEDQAGQVLTSVQSEMKDLDGKWRKQVTSSEQANYNQRFLKSLDIPILKTVRARRAPKITPRSKSASQRSIKVKSSPQIIPKSAKSIPEIPDRKPLPTSQKSVASSLDTQIKKQPTKDIKLKPRLTGPIEEVGTLTLADWRRLGDDPQEISQAILVKFKALAKESFAEHTKAVLAWRNSPLYQDYLAIGQASISQKRPIEEIINTNKSSGKETLSEAEVDAIMELNKHLRF